MLTMAPRHMQGARVNFNLFTPERYETISVYKTGFYTINCPVRLAMYVVGMNNKQSHSDVEKLLLKIGHFFQIQDDFIDCFVDPSVSGKIGTDIQDGKFCWPLVTALQSASDAQKRVLEDNYAKHDPEAIRRVKDLYAELGVEQTYREFEAKTYKDLLALVEEVTRKTGVPAIIFNQVMDLLFKRKK